MTTTTESRERTDLIAALDKSRYFLKTAVQGLDDEQAARRTTVSELCLGGLIKHVASTEATWARFIVDGPAGPDGRDMEAIQREYLDGFRMLEGETLVDLLEAYDAVAARTNELAAELADLDATQPLPAAPWFEPGARWSARTVFLHIIAETAQHAGHADILRETLDGKKSMG